MTFNLELQLICFDPVKKQIPFIVMLSVVQLDEKITAVSQLSSTMYPAHSLLPVHTLTSSDHRCAASSFLRVKVM